MLLGEHAVLHGRLAIVCAISTRIRVTLIPRCDEEIRLFSGLGQYTTTIRELGKHPNFSFVLKAIHRYGEHLPSGFDLRINSEFSHQIGFGSSAAVTVATITALRTWLNHNVVPDEIFNDSLRVVHAVQGVGSGADVAASVHGGIVAYQIKPFNIEKLSHIHPLTAVYSGNKMPTVEVIQIVEQQRKQFPKMFEQVFDLMDQTSVNAVDAIQYKDWKMLGQLMNFGQGLMDAIGVNNTQLSALVYALRNDPGILGSKISGSGLGAGNCGATGAFVGAPTLTPPSPVSRASPQITSILFFFIKKPTPAFSRAADSRERATIRAESKPGAAVTPKTSPSFASR